MDLTGVKSKLPIILPVVIGVTLLLLVALGLALLGGKKVTVPTPSPTITPEIKTSQTLGPIPTFRVVPPKVDPETLPSDIKEIRKKIIASPLTSDRGVLILFKSENYVIRYITAPDDFYVTIFKDPAPVYKKEAQNWFLAFGLKQSDLCDLPVRFILGTREVRSSNPGFSSLPDGCPN